MVNEKEIRQDMTFHTGDFTVRNIMDLFSCSGGKAQRTVNALLDTGDVMILYEENSRVIHYHFIHEDRAKCTAFLLLAFKSPTNWRWNEEKGVR